MRLSSALWCFGLLAVTAAHPASHEVDKLGAVASESSVCSDIGIGILKDGGNAADAVGSLLAFNDYLLNFTDHRNPVLRRGDRDVSFRSRGWRLRNRPL
jgi:hypothetical protein